METQKGISSLVGRIMAYEAGELNDQQTIKLFQELIDNEMIWGLQGHYQRTATGLIAAGYCHPKE